MKVDTCGAMRWWYHHMEVVPSYESGTIMWRWYHHVEVDEPLHIARRFLRSSAFICWRNELKTPHVITVIQGIIIWRIHENKYLRFNIIREISLHTIEHVKLITMHVVLRKQFITICFFVTAIKEWIINKRYSSSPRL